MEKIKNTKDIETFIGDIPRVTEKLGEVGETMENYVRQLRDDQFVGKEGETPQEKYTRLESALDKLKMTIEKRDIVTTKGKEAIEVLKEVIGKIEKITKEGESNESTLKKMNNEMIDEILAARREEMEEKLVEMFPDSFI